MAEGLALLERSATGEQLSAYHIEAAIAAVHAGLAALRRIEDRARLSNYPFYPAALADFELAAW